MYPLVSSLLGQPIISLSTGELAGTVIKPIIGLDKLEVIGFRCQSVDTAGEHILLWEDIRGFNHDCLLINNETDLTVPEDLIRLNSGGTKLVSLNGSITVTDTGRKLGRVHDSSLDIETARIQKLNVQPSFFLRWFQPKALIDRTQIIDIAPGRITVRDVVVQDPILAAKTLPETSP